ncbi:MAG TPA: hypothetical protein PK250_04415 [Syntrophobacter fumaroxidans]|nr:hypothetical protein [Syntrophobacter fumaroxidans]
MTARSSDWKPLDFEGLKTGSLKDRPSKVALDDFGRAWIPGESFAAFLDKLPRILASEQLRLAAAAFATAVEAGRTVILGMGAHPIKVGLNPILVDAIERGLLSGLALNGAGIIHDVEVALAGKTSEDVAAHLDGGTFGTARETAEFIHGAVASAYRKGSIGLGKAVGLRLMEENAPYARLSVLAAAARRDIPVTVHVAVGTDIIHMHPAMDGAATGALSHLDFRLFCRLVTTLKEGVFINLGSAVILPEVFLKAVSVARNMGFPLEGITTINMDFQRQYRTQANVVERPTMRTGTGIALIGHHEIMLPLLIAAVLERLSKES